MSSFTGLEPLCKSTFKMLAIHLLDHLFTVLAVLYTSILRIVVSQLGLS